MNFAKTDLSKTGTLIHWATCAQYQTSKRWRSRDAGGGWGRHGVQRYSTKMVRYRTRVNGSTWSMTVLSAGSF